MKRLAICLLCLVTALSAAAQFRPSYRSLNDSETVTAMREQVGFLASAALAGRKAGSEGEREAAAYVTEVLDAYGLEILSGEEGDLFGMKQESGDTLTSRNVIACIPA